MLKAEIFNIDIKIKLTGDEIDKAFQAFVKEEPVQIEQAGSSRKFRVLDISAENARERMLAAMQGEPDNTPVLVAHAHLREIFETEGKDDY